MDKFFLAVILRSIYLGKLLPLKRCAFGTFRRRASHERGLGSVPVHGCESVRINPNDRALSERVATVHDNLTKVFGTDSPLETPDRKSTRLNSSHSGESRMPSSA